MMINIELDSIITSFFLKEKYYNNIYLLLDNITYF